MKKILQELAESITMLDHEGAIRSAETAIGAGLIPPQVLEEGAALGLREVGSRFERGELFLPELIFAAKIFQAVMDVIKPVLAASDTQVRRAGRLLIGTVEGDVHDLGQNIVSTLAEVSGFEVMNLGVDVPSAAFVEKVREFKPHIVGLSALLTTTMVKQQEVIRDLEEAGLRGEVKIIIGGAPTSESWARKIGADAYGIDASDGVKKMKWLVEAST